MTTNMPAEVIENGDGTYDMYGGGPFLTKWTISPTSDGWIATNVHDGWAQTRYVTARFATAAEAAHAILDDPGPLFDGGTDGDSYR